MLTRSSETFQSRNISTPLDVTFKNIQHKKAHLKFQMGFFKN